MNIATFLDKAPRFILYGLIFLMPVFFLPFTTLPIDLNKQILLAIAVLVALALWLIDAMRTGTINIRWHAALLALFAFIASAGLSTYISSAPSHSFWGVTAEPDAFFSMFLFGLLIFAMVNLLRENSHILNTLIFFIAGAVLASVFFFLHHFLSLGFTQKSIFVPLGSFNALAIYAGGAFVVAFAFLSDSFYKPYYKTYGVYLLLAGAAVLFLTLVFMYSQVAFLSSLIGLLIVLYLSAMRLNPRNISVRPLVLPFFILALVLVFLIVPLPIKKVFNIPGSVMISKQATFDIAKKTIDESPKELLFGSGPATFGKQYLLYRSPSVNNTVFWNTDFNQGTGIITAFLATNGAIGGLLFALFIAIFLVLGAKRTLFASQRKRGKALFEQHLSAVIFAGGVYFILSWLLFVMNFSILFAGFVMLGLGIAQLGRWKEIKFIATPQGTFWGMFLGIFLLVSIIFAGYSIGKRYYAEVLYAKGISYFDNGKAAKSIIYLNDAARLGNLDRYWRGLSKASFSYASVIFKDSKMADEKKREMVQQLLSSAEGAAKKAESLNPTNSKNLMGLGNFYRNVILLNGNSLGFSLSYYTKTSKLDPQNPLISLNKAYAYLSEARRVQNKANSLIRESQKEGITDEEKLGLERRIDDFEKKYGRALDDALSEAQNALKLKGDFVDARALIAEVEKFKRSGR